jgi:hypothetical protein
MKISGGLLDFLKRFDALPDDAVIKTHETAAVTSLSERVVRRIFQRIWLSENRYGQRVGDVRELLKRGRKAA